MGGAGGGVPLHCLFFLGVDYSFSMLNHTVFHLNNILPQ